MIDKSEVRAAALGRWDMIFSVLAPSMAAAMEHPGKHVPCPVHGGKDGFRVLKDFAKDGKCVCNTCGFQSDGFSALEWATGRSFNEAVTDVGNLLGISDPYEIEVLERRPINREVVGTVLSMSFATDKAFSIQLKVGAKTNLFCDKSLGRLMKAQNIDVGNRVKLSIVEVQKVRNGAGREWRRNVWTVVKLPSEQEEAQAKARAEKENLRRKEFISSTWSKAQPFTWKGSKCQAMARYFRSRSLMVRHPELVANLRFLGKACYVDDSGAKSSLPAMVGAVRDVEGNLVTVHRTFLDGNGGKAKVATPKRLAALPEGKTINGCAVQIGKPEKVLGLAEGIETALSVAIATGLPCWSCISAEGLIHAAIPAGVKKVVIWADKDTSGTGQKAAATLAQRLRAEGRTVEIRLPKGEIPAGSKGIDWNDVIRTSGPEGFNP